MFPESSTPPSPNPQSPDTALRYPSHTHHRTVPYAALIPHEAPHRTPFAFAIVLQMPGQKLFFFFLSLYAGITRTSAKPFGWCAHVFGGRRTEAHHTLPHRFFHCPVMRPTSAWFLLPSSSRGLNPHSSFTPPLYFV